MEWQAMSKIDEARKKFLSQNDDWDSTYKTTEDWNAEGSEYDFPVASKNLVPIAESNGDTVFYNLDENKIYTHYHDFNPEEIGISNLDNYRLGFNYDKPEVTNTMQRLINRKIQEIPGSQAERFDVAGEEFPTLPLKEKLKRAGIGASIGALLGGGLALGSVRKMGFNPKQLATTALSGSILGAMPGALLGPVQLTEMSKIQEKDDEIKSRMRQELRTIKDYDLDKVACYKAEIIKLAKKDDPYGATKAVGVASIAAVPGDMAFDLTSDAVYTYKKHKNKFMRGLEGQKFKRTKAFKKMLKSKQFKEAVNMFKAKQRGFAVPVSLGLAAIPTGATYLHERKKQKK